MTTLCFGGSFNPIHHGHLLSARTVAETKGFERILLIPSGLSPHKTTHPDAVDPSHRLAMCRMAVQGDPLFDVADMEVKRTGPSYTIDTVRALRGQGWPTVHWLVGADMAATLNTWKDAADLLKETTFHVVTRTGHLLDWQRLPLELRHLAENVVTVPNFELSSTAIRERVRHGLSVRYLTPDPVVEYILQNKLYRGSLPIRTSC